MAHRAPQTAISFGPSLKRLVVRLRSERTAIVLIILLATAGIAMSVVGPKILGHATDIIFTGAIGQNLSAGVSNDQLVADLRSSGQGNFANMVERLGITPGAGIDFERLATTLVLALVLYLFSSLFLWLQSYLLNGVVQRVVYALRAEIESKIHRLPLSYFDKMARGELLSRITSDVDNISQALQQSISQILISCFMVIGVTVMMFVISPLLAIVALVTIPVSMIVTRMIAKRSQQQFVNQWRHTGQLNAQIEEAYTGHTLIRIFGRRREVEAYFSAKNEELFVASFKAQFIPGIIMPAMMFFGNINYIAIAVIGGIRVATGAMGLGDVQAFIEYSRMFVQPLTQLATIANILQSGVASFERIIEVLDAPEQSTVELGKLHLTSSRVDFERVSFAYDTAKPLIADLSLVAKPGQTVAIVGSTGAGKTTLVNLIMRFYELDAGRITLDGVDIATVPLAELRANIGMVLQDTWLFHGTIRENIAYGRPTATDEEIYAAARAAYVDRFVHLLPKGYETLIDEEGNNISAGEKQLLTIARAFLADPSLLILDEATSSVDTRTEVLIQHAMAALRSDRTSFVIAHRLSTIRNADVILVMESGAIVEQGNHDGLLAQGRRYYDLYHAQFRKDEMPSPVSM